MKMIPLSGAKGAGLVALVDDEDYERLSAYSWNLFRCTLRRGAGYAVANVQRDGRRTTIRMHRLVLPGLPLIDHIDGDALNNQRSNLRPATQSQSQCNRVGWSKTGFRGVTRLKDRPGSPFMARVNLNGRGYYLGIFSTPEEAARAYDDAARRLHGEFALTNEGMA